MLKKKLTWTIMLINEPVEDEEAQFDLVEDERAMSMVGRDPNPPFRLLRVPEDLFLKTTQKIDDNVPGLPSTHGFLPPNSKQGVNFYKERPIVVRLDLSRREFNQLLYSIFPSANRFSGTEKSTCPPTLTTYSAPSSTFL